MPGKIQKILVILATLVGVTACYPPQVQYPYTPMITQRRATLQQELVKLLPEQQQQLKAAQEEARWLADTAYKAAAGIARLNDSNFPGWAGNALINAHLQDRGLCWHYQHDMYRELRRRKLTFFRLGCCVRDRAEASEHNCLYIAPIDAEWPHAWVLDAWMWNGRLKVDKATDLDADDWGDLPGICAMLSMAYPEEHDWPIEHWYSVRTPNGKYGEYWQEYTRCSSQYRRMFENIERGKTEHPGTPTNY